MQHSPAAAVSFLRILSYPLHLDLKRGILYLTRQVAAGSSGDGAMCHNVLLLFKLCRIIIQASSAAFAGGIMPHDGIVHF